ARRHLLPGGAGGGRAGGPQLRDAAGVVPPRHRGHGGRARRRRGRRAGARDPGLRRRDRDAGAAALAPAGGAVKALAIAATHVRRVVRWRANLFFLFVLPMMIILLLGAAFGGSTRARIGVTGGQGGPLARDLVASLDA